MRRCGVVVVLFGVVLISGCSAATDATDTGETNVSEPVASETTPAEPAAFHFDSGDLIIGPFNPEEVKHNLFDPCTEISDAEFAAAGLVKSRLPADLPLFEGAVNFCAIETEDPYESGAIGVTSVPKAEILRVAEELHEHSAELIPYSFSFPPKGGSKNSCFVAVETKRGTLAALASSLRADDGFDQVCPRAQKILAELYSATNDSER